MSVINIETEQLKRQNIRYRSMIRALIVELQLAIDRHYDGRLGVGDPLSERDYDNETLTLKRARELLDESR